MRSDDIRDNRGSVMDCSDILTWLDWMPFAWLCVLAVACLATLGYLAFSFDEKDAGTPRHESNRMEENP